MCPQQADLRKGKHRADNPAIICADGLQCQVNAQPCPHGRPQHSQSTLHCAVPGGCNCDALLGSLQHASNIVTFAPKVVVQLLHAAMGACED